jgi:hypothetical protein
LTKVRRQLLADFLAAQTPPCPVCAYSLQGIESDRCPECGARLELRLASTDLRLGVWLVALVFLAVGVGFLALLSIPVGMSAALGDFTKYAALILSLHIACLLVLVSGLATVVYARRSFWKSPRRVQVMLAIVAAGLAVLVPAADFGIILYLA